MFVLYVTEFNNIVNYMPGLPHSALLGNMCFTVGSHIVMDIKVTINRSEHYVIFGSTESPHEYTSLCWVIHM